MSYCRWSSCDFWSDVYVYEHVDGTWTTHVASNRVVGDIPKELPLPQTPLPGPEWDAWHAAHQAQHEWLQTCEHRDIGLPHDGETFKDVGPAECRDGLLHLRKLGYHVPQFAIDALDEEAKEISHD